MPNFPASVYSPASKSAGQTITAAFFNDPDGEITAIEGGYLNGTARLNSSASTLASLSVTGGSTLTSLSVTGGSTLTQRPTMPPPEAVLVFLDSTVTIGSSAASTLSFLAEAFVTNSSMHSTTTNPSRLTPQSTGVYSIVGQVNFAANSSRIPAIVVQDSSANSFCVAQFPSNAGANNPFIQVNGLKRFDALGGYVVLVAQPGGASTMSISSGIGNTFFSMWKL